MFECVITRTLCPMRGGAETIQTEQIQYLWPEVLKRARLYGYNIPSLAYRYTT